MTGISLFSVCPQVGVAFEEEREEQSLFPLPNAIFFLYLVCPHPYPPSALFPCMRVTSSKYSLPLSLAVLIVCQGRRERERTNGKGKRGRVEETACDARKGAKSRVACPTSVASVAANVHETRLILRRSRFFNERRLTAAPGFALAVQFLLLLLLSAFDSSGLEGGSAAYLVICLLPPLSTLMHTNGCKRRKTRRFLPASTYLSYPPLSEQR